MIPVLKGDNGIKGGSSESLTHVLLIGFQGAITRFNPTGASMPGFCLETYKPTGCQCVDLYP